MKKVRILLLIAVAAAVAGLIVSGCATTGTSDPPVPGGSGVITISGIGATSLTLTWTKATDDATTPENLEYRAYYATVSSITTPEDVEANATPVGDWEKDIGTKDVTGLSELTDYYFAVLVRDEDGNMAAYEVAAVFTVTVTFENVPASAQTIALTISGSNMEEISKNLPAAATAVVTVPSGSSRTFTAQSSTASVTSKGETQTDLLTVDDKTVSVTFELYETKIIIPDALNNRIVQIDDMTGAGWTVLDYTDFGLAAGEFLPYDIDFDSKGRIYIANDYGNGAGTKQILRINDITDTSPVAVIEGLTVGATSIAVDRKNDFIYYGTEQKYPDYSKIFRCQYDGTNNSQFTTKETYGFPGIDIGENGTVYVMANDSDFAGFYKYDMSGNLLKGGNYSYLNFAWDVVVKPPYVYVLNTNNYEILQLDINDISQNPLKKYGTQDDGTFPDNPGEFYGPKRFVAILNKKLTLTDEVDYATKDRLVSLDDTLDGSGWEPYGANGSGTGQFSFFVMY